ncbi:MAG: C-type lectin domain-containing protein [Kofleriaceae bacterium]
MRWAVAVVLCGGCELAFPLRDEPPAQIDAPIDSAMTDVPVVDVPAPGMCPQPYGAVSGLPNRYRVVLAPTLGWKDAESVCEGEGAHLAVPLTVTEMGLYVSLVEGARTWVGIARNATATDLEYRSITGIPFPPGTVMWHAGDPNGTGPVTEIANDGDNKLADTSVVLVNRYVCECDGLPLTPFEF